MPMDETLQAPAKPKRKTGILLLALLLVVLSTAFLTVRAVRWLRDRENAKLLTLVDREHPVEDGYNVEFTLFGDGQMVDSRCVDDLEKMLAACAGAGGKPELESSFRTWGAQELLYDEALAALRQEGLSEEEAARRLETRVEMPGCSEHQLGLAVDILEQGCGLPREQQAETPTLRWLRDNSWRYGFILRYGEDQTAVTGMEYRPWHFRYVGRDAAEQIFSLGLTLEEYLSLFYSS